MAVTKISKSDLNKYKLELENIKEENIDSKLGIIEKTNKALMDIFNAPDTYAEVKDHKSDLKEVKVALEEKKNLLAEKNIDIPLLDGLNITHKECKEEAIDKKIAGKITSKEKELTSIEAANTKLEKEKKDNETEMSKLIKEIEKILLDIDTLEKNRIKEIELKTKEIKKNREDAKTAGKESEIYRRYESKYPEICNKYLIYGTTSEKDLPEVDKELATAIVEDKSDVLNKISKLKKEQEIKEKIGEKNKDVLKEQETKIGEIDKKISDIETEIDELKVSTTENNAESKDIANLDAKISLRHKQLEKYIDSFASNYENVFTDAEVGIDDTFISDIESKITLNTSIKDGNALKTKLACAIIQMAQINNITRLAGAGKGISKIQIDKANKIIEDIDKNIKQIGLHQSLYTTIELVDKRIKNLEGIETTDPKALLPNKAPDKTAIKDIKYPLKEHFLDPAKKLNEAPESYELGGLIFKDNKGTPIELFEDSTGTKPFVKKINTGENADVFIKDGTIFKKLANIEITNIANPELVIHMEAYKDLPSNLAFPADFECTMTGIGGNTKDVKNKVGITKQINGKLSKPDFAPEYTSLDGKYDIKAKLDKIFQEAYELQLKDRLYEFMENDSHTKGERAKMTSDEKNHFFQDIIKSNTQPAWLGAGIYAMITDVIQSNCYGNMDFADDFQKRILEIFTGKTESDLKKLIFEKLGNLDFTELNPTYAIKLLADKIRDKYTAHKDGLYQALNSYLLNVRNGGMKVTPEKLRHGELAGVKEIKAVVADSKELSREVAYKNAVKKIEDKYTSGVKFGYTRAKIFFFREKMLKNLIAKELKGKGGLTMDETTNSAVNRWATEKSMGGSFAENIIDVEKDTKEKIFDDPIFQQELDMVVWKYIDGQTTDDATFQSEIEELINDNAELKDYMKKNNITHLGSNIIEQAKMEKAERKYYGSVIETIDKYTKMGILNKPQEFDVAIRKLLEEFIKNQKKLPDMVKSLGLNIDKIDFATKLATHRTTLETMKMRTVKMRLSLLVNKSEEEKGLTTAQYVNQDKFDVKHATKFTKRMAKHPRWTTGATVLGLAGTGVIGALTIPVIGVAGGAGILWYLNFLKKKGHYTQEHKKFEETIIAMTPEQREKYLEDLKENSEKRPKWIRWAFPTKYSKYGESMEYFNNVDSVDNISKKIQKYLEKAGPFTANEKKAFQRNLVDAISLVQAHKEKGRNFMYGKEGNTKIEELYNDLYNLILAGVTRYNPLAKNPETVVAKILSNVKTSKKVDDTMNEYDEDYKKMRQMRNKLGIFAGTRSAGIYIGSAYALGRIKNQVIDGWDNIFGDSSHNAATTPGTAAETVITTPQAATPGMSSTILDPAFGPNGDLLKAQIFNGDVTKFNAFVAKIQNIPPGSHSEKLWSVFKDIYGTDQLANSKTHDFFNLFSSRISDMPASAQQELIKLGTNFNLHSGQQISDLMTSRGYNGMVTNQADINSLLAGFKSGAIDLNNLPAGWTKETAANVLFCNAQGDQLTELIFDTATTPVVPPIEPTIIPPTPPVEPPVTPPVTPGSSPRYKNFLSFGVPTVWNEVNKFNENEQTTRDEEE